MLTHRVVKGQHGACFFPRGTSIAQPSAELEVSKDTLAAW